MLAALCYVLFFFILDTASRMTKRHVLQNQINDRMDKIQRKSFFAFMAVVIVNLLIILGWGKIIPALYFEVLLDLTFLFLVPTLRIYHLARRDVLDGLPWVDE